VKRTLVAATSLPLMAFTLACSASKTPCEELVLKHLKAPATAEFTIKFSDNKETVGWVDSQNSYGAKLRMGFVCVIGSDHTHEIYSDDKPHIAFVDEPRTYIERLEAGRPIFDDQWQE